MDSSPASGAVALSGKIMMAAIVVLFMVVLFILGLHIYARCCWRGRMGASRRNSSRRRRVQILGEDHVRVGLEPSVIEKLPVFVYSKDDHPEGAMECAVCLCEFEEKEEGRLLPKCKHSFHTECIDMWFASHSTCPLCRASAQPEAKEDLVFVIIDGEAPTTESSGENTTADTVPSSPPYPTNVLFWGSQNSIAQAASSSASGCVDREKEKKSFRSLGQFVIDVPRRIESFSSRTYSPRGIFGGDDQQSCSPAKSPSTRFRSFKRLMSRDKGLPQSPQASSSNSRLDHDTAEAQVYEGRLYLNP